MRRWISELLDDAMFPMLKLMSPGYRRRMAPYRPAAPCEVTSLRELAPPGEVRLCDEPSWRGFRAQGYEFDSPVECECAENRLATGRLLVADPDGPWAVIVPGYATGAVPGTGYGLFQSVQGRALLERQVNVALIDPPYHMRRKRPGCLSGEGFFSPDLGETQNTVRQAAADTIALIRWLRERHGRRVALWGTSMGGCIAGLAATQADELSALVLMEPRDNPGPPMAVLPSTYDIRDQLARHGVSPEEIPEALRSVAPSTYPPAVPLERILFITPLWDRVVPTRFQHAFWDAWGRPARILVDSSHVTLAKDLSLTARAADFLTQRLR